MKKTVSFLMAGIGTQQTVEVPEDFVLIRGGTFYMGAPKPRRGEVKMKYSTPLRSTIFILGCMK